jgi:Ca2+/Na+ antiporter
MKLFKEPIKLAYIYSAASVIIGPGLVIFSGSRHPSGWDCSDSSWDITNTPIAAREAIYEHNARFMVAGAYIALVLGMTLLIYLFYDALKNKKISKVILPAIIMLFMMVGYFLIIPIGSSHTWCYP